MLRMAYSRIEAMSGMAVSIRRPAAVSMRPRSRPFSRWAARFELPCSLASWLLTDVETGLPVWQGKDVNGDGILGQRYSADGTPQGGEFLESILTNIKNYFGDDTTRITGEVVLRNDRLHVTTRVSGKPAKR